MELRVEGSVMALDEDGFLPAAFRKVQKIGKGLKSNGTSNIAGFLLRNRSSHKAWERLKGSSLCERSFVYILHEQVDRPLLVGFLS